MIVLLQALGHAPQRIFSILEGRSEEFIRWVPDVETWSARMTVAHLYHAEELFQERFKNILAGGSPLLRYFGPQQAGPDSKLGPAQLLDGFAGRRKSTLDLLYTLKPEDWNLPAHHETQGATTLAQQVHTMINHDTGHLGQLYDLVVRWESVGSEKYKENG